jgi:proton-dependent oligopeptide transporter, POT family
VSAGNGVARDKSGEFLGHPKGLYILFLTEMWERFSFYGMRALLIFYLTKHFLFSDEVAVGIYGAYGGLVFAAPILGGAIADRWLGFRKAVVLGAILLTLGHFGMAFEGKQAETVLDAAGNAVIHRDPVFLQIFYFSLALLVSGVGFLKACISSIVGQLYEKNDLRRDSGFTIFYMGINLGAFLGQVLCGYLGETFGWQYGFGLAGIGMLGGLLIFTRGQKHFLGRAEPPDPAALKKPVLAGINREWTIYGATIFGIVVIWQLIQRTEIVGHTLGVSLVICALIVVYFAFAKCEREDRDRLLVLLALMLFSIFFWTLFEQAGTSMNLFADRNVDRVVLGWTAPASTLQSLNPFFIISLAPLFAWLWMVLSRRNANPLPAVKFALGILQAGLGFFILVYGIRLAGPGGSVGLIWLALAYFFHTSGELSLSPIGLSAVTKLSVPRIVGFMMGGWFLSTAAAEYAASLFAKLASTETAGGEVVDKVAALAGYEHLFLVLAVMAMGAGALLLLISPILKRGMHGVR